MGDRARTRGLRSASMAVLLFGLALVVTSSTQAVYRVRLPTEGWDVSEGQTVEDFDAGILIFTSNLLGEPSPLRAGDRLSAVEGVQADEIGWTLPPSDPDWHARAIARYTIIREGQTIEIDVPLKRWTIATVARHISSSPGNVSGLLAGLLMAGIGLFVLLKRPGEPAARALLLLGTAFLASTISSGVVPDGPTTRLSYAWPLAAFFSYWIFAALIAPTVFILALVFPRPKRVVQRFPTLVVLPYLAFWILVAIFGGSPEIGWRLTGTFLLLALVGVLHSTFALRDAVSRAQLLWGLGGFLGAIALYVPYVLLVAGFVGNASSKTTITLIGVTTVLSGFAFPVFGLCLGIAILRYRLFDIDVIIRRTLVYATLTSTLGALYVASVVVLQTLLRPVIGENNQLVVVVSTLAIAALFQPLRRRIQSTIDRRFYRRKYDAARIVQSFSSGLRDEVDIGRLSDDLLDVVEQTLQPSSVSLWLRAPDRRGKV